MGILKSIFGGDNKRKSGIYKIQAGNLIELDESPGGGSINDIIRSLGYELNQVHTIMTFDSKEISNIGVKALSKKPVFVLTNDGVSNLKVSTLKRELSNIDWGFEYESTEVQSILAEGIENANLTLDFLSDAVKLDKKSENIYKAVNFGLLLHFANGKLIRFSSSDGLSAESKWLKNINPNLFNSMLAEAKQFQESEMDALNEVDKQCIALRSIPEATNNPFISKHLNHHGNYSFYNLNAAHYLPKLTIEEFLKINKGRYIKLSDSQIKVYDFIYSFDENGMLIESWED